MALPQLTLGDTVSHIILHGGSYPLKVLRGDEKRMVFPFLFLTCPAYPTAVFDFHLELTKSKLLLPIPIF